MSRRKYAIFAAVGVLLGLTVYALKPKYLFAAQTMANIGKAVHITDAADNERRGLDPDITPTLVIEHPLTYNSSTGEYLMSFEIAGVVFRAVPDTGSEFVVVAGQSCSSCTRDEGLYTMTGTKLDNAKPDSITYGSQTDTIEWWIDEFGAQDTDATTPITFGVVVSVTGSSNLNVFGLAGSKTFGDQVPLVTQLFFQQQIMSPYLFFDFQTPGSERLILGTLSSGIQASNTFPYLDQNAMKQESGLDFGLDYYMVRVVNLQYDGKTVENMPKYCMLDTGNTDFTLPTGVYTEIAMADAQEISVTFENNFQLSWDMGTFKQNVEGAEWLSAFGNQVFILGNKFMQGKVWNFNLKDELVSVIE